MSIFTPRALSVNTPDQARAALERIGVDPGGVGMMSGKMLHRCIHLPAMQCRQANILKQEMLSLGGEAAVARGTVACSIDRTAVVLIGTDKQLDQLCAKLKAQPFNLACIVCQRSNKDRFNLAKADARRSPPQVSGTDTRVDRPSTSTNPSCAPYVSP